MSSSSPIQPLAIVTGAASGIGRATTTQLINRGSRVIALDRDHEKLTAMAGEFDTKNIVACLFDLARTQDIPDMLATLVDQHGPITQMVNNAGVWAGGPITTLSDADWHLNFEINVTAPFMFMRALVPTMAQAGGGAIVNVASRNAYRSSVNNAAYDASKAAMVALTRTAAGEFARDHIRVNTVCPGVINTPGDAGINEKKFKDAYTRLIPMNRYGKPDEVATTIAFLLSSDAGFITGQSIIIDGGQIACQDNQRFMEIYNRG